jgi:hypothetical protein
MGLTYIASVTASSSATLSFTTGIDSTYNEYQFHFVNMHPQTDSVNFQFQVNAHDGSSQLTGFNETITSTFFYAYHRENDALYALTYNAGNDQAQGTAYQIALTAQANNNDTGASGILTLYDPASTTYVKHFTIEGVAVHTENTVEGQAFALDHHVAGYINTTNAITQISFQMHSGNIDSGTIHMYGVG